MSGENRSHEKILSIESALYNNRSSYLPQLHDIQNDKEIMNLYYRLKKAVRICPPFYHSTKLFLNMCETIFHTALLNKGYHV